jgi:hypothetical protein
MVEAAVKAVGLALRQALRTGDQVFSTKGPVALSAAGERPKKSTKRGAGGTVKGAAKSSEKGAAKGSPKGAPKGAPKKRSTSSKER